MNPVTCQKDYSTAPSGMYPWFAGVLQHKQINKCDIHINKLNKNHMIISIDTSYLIKYIIS